MDREEQNFNLLRPVEGVEGKQKAIEKQTISGHISKASYSITPKQGILPTHHIQTVILIVVSSNLNSNGIESFSHNFIVIIICFVSFWDLLLVCLKVLSSSSTTTT